MSGNFLDFPKLLAPIDKKDSAIDNFEVLASKEELQIIAKEIGDEVRHPVTIIDANRINNGEKDNIRVNSDSEYFSLRNSCKLLRHFAGSERCYDCDYKHAKKFMEYLYEHHEDPDFSDCTENHYIKEQEDVHALGFFYVKGFERPLYEYRCPMFGYRELLIPIFFPPESDEIIGILFIGQSIIESEEEKIYIKNAKESFFINNNSSELFSNAHDPAEIKNLIIADTDRELIIEKALREHGNVEKDQKETTMSFADLDSYINFIRETCDYLRKKEKKLLKTYAKKRRGYFKKKAEDIVNSFFDEMKNVSNNNDFKKRETYFKLETAWKLLKQSTNDLEQDFGINNIYIFGDATDLDITEKSKKSLYPKENNDWYYDFNVVDTISIQTIQFASSLGKPDEDKTQDSENIGDEIINGLYADEIDKENCFIILFCDIALVFCVNNLKEKESVYKDLANEIGKQFSRIHSSIGLLTADFVQERQVMTLRMNRHENAHIAERLNDRLKKDFSDEGKKFVNLPDVQRGRIIDDLKDASVLLSNMSENIGIVVGSVTKENICDKVGKTNIDSLLNKWRKMFSEKLIERNLNMIVSRSQWALNEIETVPSLFELMIYNIVDNAVKYAYRGTNIYLSWDKTSDGHIFTAINYGPEIKDDERIFDLYVRGSEVEKAQKIEGDGIGLYSVSKICKLLGCEVNHNPECKKVSEYHLPLIGWYIELFGQQNNKSIELNDYDLSFDRELKREIVNYHGISRNKITKLYLNKRIDNKIYKTVFTIKVPNKFKGDN